MNNDSSISQLAQQLRAEVATRQPGDQLPSSRRLVELHRVSPVTVSRALAMLATEGLVVSRPGAGTFVTRPPGPEHPLDHSWQTVVLGERAIGTQGLSPAVDTDLDDTALSLATGYLHSSLMPTRALSAALTRAARRPDVWERPPTNGLAALRAWFARTAGPAIDPREVIITTGGQGAISAAFRALVPAGAPLLVESPTYPGALAVARAAGIRPVPVPTDADGVIPDLLAAAFARTGAQAFFCQPTYQNPTGAVLSANRRAEVLAAAGAARAFIIEDDFARLLPHSRRAPAPLLAADEDGRVIYLTSLTKPASASLRVGALIARGPVGDRLRAMRVVDDLFVARSVQETALELLSRPSWERHLRELSASLDRRAGVLCRALAAALPELRVNAPSGGMHLWARLPAGWDDVGLAHAARRNGVVVMPGRPFFPAETSAAHLRLTFSAAPTEADLDLGVTRLAEAARRIVVTG